MNENQKRQIEEARRESIEKSENVCANGEKKGEREYDEFANQINNE